MRTPLTSTLAALILIASSNCLYAASSFNEVKDVVFGPPPAPQTDQEALEESVYAQGLLPHYQVTVSNFVSAGVNVLAQDAKRTLTDTSDYFPRIEKLVHSNGICFAGTWNIDTDTPYTGYFSKGAQGLLIARASTALSETERGQPRAFGFAGKLYPTMDPTQTADTANFFLVDVLMGAQRNRYLDVKLTNQPLLGFRWSVLYLAYRVAVAFSKADTNPGYRPLYPISELGLAPGTSAVTPKYMMLEADPSTPRNDDVDFRDELNIEKHGGTPLLFDILVSDTTSNRSSGNWKKIGTIQLNDSTVSYGCDRRLHFHHPKMM